MMPNGTGPDETPLHRNMARVERAKTVALSRLLAIPGVHAVGIGYKRRGGEELDELAVVVFVDKKLRPEDVPPDWMVPPDIRFFMDSVEEEEVVRTDVVEQPRPVEFPHIPDGTLATRARPAAGGRSIWRSGGGGGTLGGWVWDDLNDEVVLLTNHHVLGGVIGTPVFQPWGSTAAADHIADLVRTGTLDATIAVPVTDTDVLQEIEGLGPAVYEVTPATLKMEVEKSGATTEHTIGRVEYVSLTPKHPPYASTNDFLVKPINPTDPPKGFGWHGDSGSLIVESNKPPGRTWKRVVGLLWGGIDSGSYGGWGYAHQIQDVFENLNLGTLCAGAFEEFLDNLFVKNFSTEPVSVTPIQLPGPVAAAITPQLPTTVPVLALILQQVTTGARRPRALHRGIARDVERRLCTTRAGNELVAAIHEHRVGLVRLILDRGTRRAIAAAAAPFVDGIWTAEELLGRQVTDDDISRFHRLVRMAEDQRPELRPLLEVLNRIIEELPGRSLIDVMR